KDQRRAEDQQKYHRRTSGSCHDLPSSTRCDRPPLGTCSGLEPLREKRGLIRLRCRRPLIIVNSMPERHPQSNALRRGVLRAPAATVLLAVFLVVLVTPGRAAREGAACDAPDLVCRASQNQDRSLFVRDRCRFEQHLLMERFEYDDDSHQQGALVSK